MYEKIEYNGGSCGTKLTYSCLDWKSRIIMNKNW